MKNSAQFKVHETNKTYGRNLTVRMIDVSRRLVGSCRCFETARFYVRRCRVFDDYYVHIQAMGRLKIHIALF